MIIASESSEAAVTALIVQQNAFPAELPKGGLVFGKVTALTDGSGRVQVPVVANYDTEYEGKQVVRYRRLDLGKAYNGLRPSLTQIGYATLHQMLPIINQFLGTKFGTRDVLDVKLDWLGNNERLNIQITAANQSLVYEGSFVLTYVKIRPLLNKVITKRSLPVLNHPADPQAGLKSLPMTMFGMDFTGEETKALRVYANRRWWDLAAMRALMVERGLPANWPDADYSAAEFVQGQTKDVPGANTDYTNVIVQKNVKLDGYTGDAYFHYNRT